MQKLGSFQVGEDCIDIVGDELTGIRLYHGMEPYADLRAGAPGYILLEGEFLVKTNDAYRDLREPLLQTGLFIDTGQRVESGYVQLEVWILAASVDDYLALVMEFVRAIDRNPHLNDGAAVPGPDNAPLGALEQMDAFNAAFHSRIANACDATPECSVARCPELLVHWYRGLAAADFAQVMATCDCDDAGRCFQPDAAGPTCLRKRLEHILAAQCGFCSYRLDR